jgi:predicted ribosomally synthesized peptide with nif11-like leader
VLTAAVVGAKLEAYTPLRAMSEEQLAALLAKLKDDAGLREKLQGAADLDAVLVIAKDAGFDISKADWLRYQAQQIIELSDEELEGVAGGRRQCSPVSGLMQLV